MARLRDVPPVIRKIGIREFLLRVYRKILGDNLTVWSSALAYSWLFAIFPFFIFLLTLVPYLPGSYKKEAKDDVIRWINYLPKDAAVTVRDVVEPRLNQLLEEKQRGIASIGVLLTLWGASGGMRMTMAALDRTYGIQKPRPFWKQYPLSMFMTAAATAIVIGVIILVPIGTTVTRTFVEMVQAPPKRLDDLLEKNAQIRAWTDWVRAHIGSILVIWQTVRYSAALILSFALISLIYHVGPNLRQRWRAVTPGALFTVAVWFLLGSLFRVYVDRFGKYNQTYGAVGGVAILLLLFYIDGVILLIGSEINSEIDRVVLDPPPGTRDYRALQDKIYGPPKRWRRIPFATRLVNRWRRRSAAAGTKD